MEMDYGIISCIPITVLMVGVLLTKRITEMMVVASLLGAILIHKGDFFSGYIDMIYGTLSNSSYHFVLFILMGFGGMIKLFQESGALLDILRLPAKYKQVLLLYYYQDLTLEEIAQALQMSRSTVHHRLKKAEALLRNTLTGGDIDEK